jgi:hypothetical protein
MYIILFLFVFLRTMPDTEATVTVGIARAAANPSQQGHWRKRCSFLRFATNFELDSQRKRNIEQPKSPETSDHLRLISKKSSRGLTNASEGTEAWSLELRVPRKKDLQKSPKSWQPGFRVQHAARTTKKLSLREQGSWKTPLTK